jgi:fermentation-respiration switch protein FrsA (DUF1100 family)
MKPRALQVVLVILVITSLVALAGCDSGGQPNAVATIASLAPTTATSTIFPTPQPTSATTPAGLPTTIATASVRVPAAQPTAASTAVPQALIDLAKKIITQMSQGDFADVETQFDDTMQSQIPQDKLKSAWDQLVANYGAYKGQKNVTTGQQGGFNIVVVTTGFASSDLDIRLVFGQDGRVAGLFFQPTNPSAQPTYVPPPYVDQSKFTEKEVTVGSGQWQLPGTLTLPAGKGPFPGVVLVHGSGPEDRDETIGPNKPFRDLAWGLASQGIAVLRYDKRTYTYQKQMSSLQDTITVKEEVTDDAVLALNLMRKLYSSSENGVDPNRVFLLGHSLGGMLVPMIVQQQPTPQGTPYIAGAIVMAGPTRPFEDILLDQAKYIANLDGVVSDAEQQQLSILQNQIANVKKPDLSSSTPATDLPLGLAAPYWLSLRGYNPAQVAAGQKEPMFIMQGLRDYQVKEVDFNGWKSALSGRANVTFKLYPNVNHIFKEGEGMGTPDEYNMPGHVSQEAVDDIGAWILKQ